MAITKSTIAVNKKRHLFIPVSVKNDAVAREMWKWATATYVYGAADRLALTMLCHAWSEYSKHYLMTKSGQDGKGGATSPMTAWFDRVTKLMFCLGMMPSQRTAPGGGPENAAGLETRGADGSLPDGMPDMDGVE